MYKGVKEVISEEDFEKKIGKDVNLQFPGNTNMMAFADKSSNYNIIRSSISPLYRYNSEGVLVNSFNEFFVHHFIPDYECKLQYKFCECTYTSIYNDNYMKKNLQCSYLYIHNIVHNIDIKIVPFILKDSSLLNKYVHFVKQNREKYKINCLNKDIRKLIED